MHESAKATRAKSSYDIFPSEAWDLISKNRGNKDMVIIDVSTPYEYKDKHLNDAINVNLFSRFIRARLHVMDKSATYLLYCKLGGRSKVAQKLMQRFGFQKVYNIIGGTFLWKEEGLPFAPGADGVNKFSFCPFSISIVTFKKIKKISRNLLSHISQRNNIATSVGHES